MTTTLPPAAQTQTPAHITARIFVATSHATADQEAAPPAYVGRHRRPSRIARVATLVAFVSLYLGACVAGIQLFSTAW
jgi:hypothetical protein